MIDLNFYDEVEIFHQPHQMNIDYDINTILSNFEKNIKKKDYGSISLYYGKTYNQFKIFTLLFYENKEIKYSEKYEEFLKNFKDIYPDTICKINDQNEPYFVSYILTYFDEDFDKKMTELFKRKGED